MKPADGLSYRPMYSGDLDAIHAIEICNYTHPWSKGNFADSLNAGYSCWVIEHRSSLVGYAVQMVAAGEAHLLNISIAVDWQGKGFGRDFLLYLCDVAKGHGAKEMFLEVRKSNVSAQGLYRQLGFQEYGVRKRYYPAVHGREDAVVMGLHLQGLAVGQSM